MKITQLRIYLIAIGILSATTFSCTGDSESDIDQIENSVRISGDSENENSSNAEETIPEEIKIEIEEKKAKRDKILEEEMSKSSFKESSDEEVKEFLSKELSRFRNSCDTAVYNSIFKLMQTDMRMKQFTFDEDVFTEDFADHLFATRDSCLQ